ncbi:MAG: hypothetical protein Q4A82_02860 [Corynebacterium sp.]|nr:hypothetical protein [Corynebacterium sp.]
MLIHNAHSRGLKGYVEQVHVALGDEGDKKFCCDFLMADGRGRFIIIEVKSGNAVLSSPQRAMANALPKAWPAMLSTA